LSAGVDKAQVGIEIWMAKGGRSLALGCVRIEAECRISRLVEMRN
jgi:hypothetical protein